MIHGKYINQGEELTDVLKVRQLSLCDAIADIGPEADALDPLAVNILVDLPLEALGLDVADGQDTNAGASKTSEVANVRTGETSERLSLVGVSPDDGKKVLYIGCGRILCDIDRFRFYIDQIAILPELRNQGFGEFALRMLVDKANVCGAQKVWLKLPEKWASKEAEEKAIKFFTGMHFKPEAYDEENSVDGRWMAADVTDFHSCCHH